MNRKILAACLALVLVLTLFAGCTDKCNDNDTEAPDTAAPVSDAPKTEAPETEPPKTTAPETEAPETEGQETEPVKTDVQALNGDAKAIAEGLIGSPVEDLFAAIGEPKDASYASSCDGPGDDGELYYEGFTVYTYREDGKETVTDVYGS